MTHVQSPPQWPFWPTEKPCTSRKQNELYAVLLLFSTHPINIPKSTLGYSVSHNFPTSLLRLWPQVHSFLLVTQLQCLTWGHKYIYVVHFVKRSKKKTGRQKGVNSAFVGLFSAAYKYKFGARISTQQKTQQQEDVYVAVVQNKQ